MDPCAYCNATAGRRASSQLVAIFLLAAHTIFYRLSLAPGDGPNWIKDNAARLCLLVAASATSITAACAVVYGLRFSHRLRFIWLVGSLTTVTLNILSDLGGSVERHGQYNAIVFAVVIAVPLALTCVVFTLSRCFGLSHYRVFFGSLLMVSFAAWRYWLRVSKGREDWPLGLWDERIIGTEGCPMSWVSGVSSFIDGFPARILNFWAGNLACPGAIVIATWDDSGMLSFVNECKNGGGGVVLLPANISKMALHERGDQSVLQVFVSAFCSGQLNCYAIVLITIFFQEYVLKNSKTIPLLATGSIFLPQGEAVVATCGSAKQFLVRHGRIPDDEIVATASNRAANTTSSNLNVVLLFLDSMSRRHFFRTMPKVRTWLYTGHPPHVLFQTKALLEHFCWNCDRSHVALQYLQVNYACLLLCCD
jgi:hypothetical protein